MLTIQKKLSNLFYVILGLPSTAMGFALSIQIAVLSWILRTKYNLEIDQIGIVWAAGPIAGILGQPIIGMISDKVWFWGGRRRPFIIIGGILAGLMIFALPNIDKIDNFFGIGSLMAVAITVALTLDLSINISFNPTRSIIADVTPDGQPRTKGYTWMQSISNLFGSAAYLIGALAGNYFLIYAGVAIVIIFSILPLFFIEEPRKLISSVDPGKNAGNTAKEGMGHTPKSPTQWGELFKLYFAHGFSWLGIQTMFVYMFAFLEQKMPALSNTSVPDQNARLGQMIGWSFFILNAAGSIWPAFLLEPMSKKLGRVKTHAMMVATMALGYFGIVLWAKNAVILYSMMCILTFGWAAVVSLPFAIMSEKVDKARMGFFMGIFNLSVVIPQLISSSVLGTVIKNSADKGMIFIISGFSLAISAVLWLFVKENRKVG
ncbi:MAG: MFS transporter [Bacteroidales bacterium]|jgi:Na+/melibiose symporter-like transporter|nr:MFS transporter [Bacteroidales bacterium]